MSSDPSSSIAPRLVDRDEAARYVGSVSADTIDRLINSGELPIVRLPAQRSRNGGHGVTGVNRRILIDVRDLDLLIERSKERRA
jgi:hypothetical protein